MKLVAIFEDQIIEKDDVAYKVDDEDWTLTQDNKRYVNWDGSKGAIAYTDNTISQKINNESELDVYVTFFTNLEAAYASREASLNSIDTKYYTVGSLNRTTNTYASTAKSLATIKTEQVAATKREANQLLRQTDWYMIRYFELGPSNPDGAVPAAVSTYREQIRAASHTYCTALLAAGDFSAATSVADVSWPTELDSNTYYLSA
jgi:methionine synthase I (cobalamin-dependent)